MKVGLRDIVIGVAIALALVMSLTFAFQVNDRIALHWAALRGDDVAVVIIKRCSALDSVERVECEQDFIDAAQRHTYPALCDRWHYPEQSMDRVAVECMDHDEAFPR